MIFYNFLNNFFKSILVDICDEFIGFTIGHSRDDLNGLSVYRGPRGGRYFFSPGTIKHRYLRSSEEILPAIRLVILHFLIFKLKTKG
jgi:hypothetical protein